VFIYFRTYIYFFWSISASPRPTQPEPAQAGMSIRRKLAGLNRHIAWYTSSYPWSRSVRWMPGCRIGLRRSAPTYGKR